MTLLDELFKCFQQHALMVWMLTCLGLFHCINDAAIAGICRIFGFCSKKIQ